MRRLLLLLPLVVGFCSCDLSHGGRFLENERVDRDYRNTAGSHSYSSTAIENGLNTIVAETIGNIYLSDEEMFKKLDDEFVKRGTEEFYAVLEFRDIVKKLDKWIEKQGWTSEDTVMIVGKPKSKFLRDEVLHIAEKRMICNRYLGSTKRIEKEIGKELYSKSFVPEIQSLIDNIYFDCSKVIDIVGNWLLSLTREPPESRIQTLIRNFGDTRNTLYSEMFDYGGERDFLNTIRGEYDAETMKAFQIYYEQRTETKLYGDKEYLNVTSRFKTFERSFFQTLPKEISEQLPKIYTRIEENTRQINDTRRIAHLIVIQLPNDAMTEQEKVDLLKELMPAADKLIVGRFLSWVKIYDNIEEYYGTTYSVSILNEFRAILLRYIYNAVSGILTPEQQELEFDLLVGVIEAERGENNAQLIRDLMDSVKNKKKDLFNQVEADALLDDIREIVDSNNTIPGKVEKLQKKFSYLQSAFNTVMQFILPILYAEEYKDVYSVRHGEELIKVVNENNRNLLAKKIYKLYDAKESERKIDELLKSTAEKVKNTFGVGKTDDYVKDIKESIELDHADRFGLPKTESSEILSPETEVEMEDPVLDDNYSAVQQSMNRPYRRSHFATKN